MLYFVSGATEPQLLQVQLTQTASAALGRVCSRTRCQMWTISSLEVSV